jgi:DNA-binding NtrC family response regulator
MVAPVLIIEDDHDFAASLELALGLIGVDAIRVESAEQALELLDVGVYCFRLVFCDVKLPGIDGIACLEQVRGRDESLVCVLMTGFRDDVLFERARNVGVVEILLKPFKMSDFMALTKKYLETDESQKL